MQHTMNLNSHLLSSGVADVEENKNEHSKSSNEDLVTCSAVNNTSSVSNAELSHIKDTRQAKLLDAIEQSFAKQIADVVNDTQGMSLQKEDKVETQIYTSSAYRNTLHDKNKGDEAALHEGAKKTEEVLHKAAKLNEDASLKEAKKEQQRINKDATNNFRDLREIRRLSYVAVVNALSLGFTFDRELATLQEMLLPPHGQLTELLCSDLTAAIEQVWDHFTIHRFGSMVSGLAFIGSDLDVMVDTTLTCNHSGSIKKHKLLTVVGALTRCGCFTNIFPIPEAHVPIIKCMHIPTSINCDISFDNFSALQNTKLIKYYMSLDERVEPMLLILKFLAKFYNLKPSLRLGLSSYALVMMAFFYLMQLEVPILPSVFHLQKNCVPLIVDGWNCAFNPGNYIPKLTPNTSSLLDLLRGFFEFYSIFDFSMYVVSPFIGKALPKIAFQNEKQLPSEMESYCQTNLFDEKGQPITLKIRYSMCVQDPFRLKFIVTSSITASIMFKIRALCLCAARVLRDHGPSGILQQLLNMQLDSIEWSAPASDDYAEIRVNMGTYLPPVGAETTVRDVQSAWFKLVYNLVVDDIFKRVCKFRVENDARCMDVVEGCEQAAATNTAPLDGVIVICKSSGPTLLSQRKQAMKVLRATILQPEMSLIEKEELVSDHMMQQEGDVETAEFECRFRMMTEPTHVILQLVNRTSSVLMFKKWYSFLDGVISRCYKVVEGNGYEKLTQLSPGEPIL